MTECLVAITQNSIHLVEALTGAEFGTGKGVELDPRTIRPMSGDGHIRGSSTSANPFDIFIALDARKPIIHFYRGNRLEKACQHLTAPEKLTSICPTNRGQILIAGSEKGNLWVWELSSGSLLNMFSAYWAPIRLLQCSSDENFLFTGSDDGVVHMFSMAELLMSRQKQGCSARTSLPRGLGAVTALEISHDFGLSSGWIAIGYETGDLVVTNPLRDFNGAPTAVTVSFKSPVECLSFSKLSGDRLIIALRDGRLLEMPCLSDVFLTSIASNLLRFSEDVTLLETKINEGIKQLLHSHDDCNLYILTKSGRVIEWDTIGKHCRQKFTFRNESPVERILLTFSRVKPNHRMSVDGKAAEMEIVGNDHRSLYKTPAYVPVRSLSKVFADCTVESKNVTVVQRGNLGQLGQHMAKIASNSGSQSQETLLSRLKELLATKPSLIQPNSTTIDLSAEAKMGYEDECANLKVENEKLRQLASSLIQEVHGFSPSVKTEGLQDDHGSALDNTDQRSSNSEFWKSLQQATTQSSPNNDRLHHSAPDLSSKIRYESSYGTYVEPPLHWKNGIQQKRQSSCKTNKF